MRDVGWGRLPTGLVGDADAIKAAVDVLEKLRASSDMVYVVVVGHVRLLDAVLAVASVPDARRRKARACLQELPYVRSRSMHRWPIGDTPLPGPRLLRPIQKPWSAVQASLLRAGLASDTVLLLRQLLRPPPTHDNEVRRGSQRVYCIGAPALPRACM
jgi:hypothetical protein